MQEITFTLSMDRMTKDVEIRSSTGRRVARVAAMSTETMTLRYADVMCTALNAASNINSLSEALAND